MGSSIIEKGARHVTILLTRFEGLEKMERVLVPQCEYSHTHTNRCMYMCLCFCCSDSENVASS